MTPEPKEHATHLEIPPDEATEVVSEAVEVWGGGLQGDELHLPVAAGLRHGVVRGRIRIEPEAEGSRVVFWQESSEYWLQTTSVAFLCLAAAGAILVVLWPFFPPESDWMQVAPLGAVLALAGWFLVTSRIVTRDVGSFLDLLEELSSSPAESE